MGDLSFIVPQQTMILISTAVQMVQTRGATTSQLRPTIRLLVIMRITAEQSSTELFQQSSRATVQEGHFPTAAETRDARKKSELQ
jgi:hypothetical protein